MFSVVLRSECGTAKLSLPLFDTPQRIDILAGAAQRAAPAKTYSDIQMRRYTAVQVYGFTAMQ